MFKLRLAYLVEEGQVSQEDFNHFQRFTSMNKTPAFNLYLYGKLGQLPHLQNDADYLGTCRVMEALGLDRIQINKKTAQPYEQ